MYIAIGHDIFREGGLKLNRLSFFWYGIIGTVWMCSIYTVFVTKLIVLLTVFPYLGVAIQVKLFPYKIYLIVHSVF